MPGPERPSGGAEEYEEQHVHSVYQHIAPHFSATRFKPWPIVERFLLELPPGSVGLDVGCGNGKYMTVNPNIYLIGSDRSPNLAGIAHERKVHDCLVADGLHLPHPAAKFDFAISIAVIHHFSSAERRVTAIKCILETLKRPPGIAKTGGKALIFVWALEQKNSRRGWDVGDQQDVFVPWVISRQYDPKTNHTQMPTPGGAAVSTDTSNTEVVTYQRYYHLYRTGELESNIVAAGGVVLESGYERDNWWAVCAREH